MGAAGGFGLRTIAARQAHPAEALEFELQLLAEAESRESLYVWESADPRVVLPRSGKPALDVRPESSLPVLKRQTGGGAVVIGPGCLNYALALSLDRRPELYDVSRSYCRLLTSVVDALEVDGVCIEHSDLTIAGRKFAGHAQRRTSRGVLHHGTILYDFDLSLISRALHEPSRRPPHRGGRTHDEFLTNLPLPRDVIETRLLRLAARFQ